MKKLFLILALTLVLCDVWAEMYKVTKNLEIKNDAHNLADIIEIAKEGDIVDLKVIGNPDFYGVYFNKKKGFIENKLKNECLVVENNKLYIFERNFKHNKAISIIVFLVIAFILSDQGASICIKRSSKLKVWCIGLIVGLLVSFVPWFFIIMYFDRVYATAKFIIICALGLGVFLLFAFGGSSGGSEYGETTTFTNKKSSQEQFKNIKSKTTAVYCKYCGEKYPSIQSLTSGTCYKNPNGKNHALYEGNENNKYYCMYCGEKYSSIQNLTSGTCYKNPNGKNHAPYKGNENNKYYCMYCGEKYSSIQSLTSGTCYKNPNGKNHAPYKGNESNKYYCMYCGEKYSSIQSLTSGTCYKNPNGRNHAQYKGNEKDKYYCMYCGEKYSSIQSLTSGTCYKNPNSKNHAPYEGDEKSKYFCMYCGEQYSSIQNLTSGTCYKNPNGKNHFPAN